MDGPNLEYALNKPRGYFKSPSQETIFNTGNMYDEDGERFVKSICRCLDDHKINKEIHYFWYPCRDAYSRKLSVEKCKYDELSFYEVRWSYLLCTLGDKPEDFRAFIILRNNIKVHGKAYELKDGNAFQIPGDGQVWANADEDDYYLLSHYIDRSVCRDDWNFPLVKTIPITMEEFNASMKEVESGRNFYFTLFMNKIFQNCISAQIQMDNDHYMDLTARQFAKMFHRKKFLTMYKGIELPFDLSECTAKKQPTNDGKVSKEDIAAAAMKIEIPSSSIPQNMEGIEAETHEGKDGSSSRLPNQTEVKTVEDQR